MSDTTTSPRASLYAKLALIADAIPSVECDKKHLSMDAWYVSLDRLSTILNPILAQHQIAIIPMADEESREPTGATTKSGASFVQSVNRMCFVIADGTTGETIQCPWVATGTDHQGFDLQKSQTAALRTFLLALFRVVCVEPKAKQSQQPAPQQATPQQATPQQATKQPVRPAPRITATNSRANLEATEAEQRFYARYGEKVGRTWEAVVAFMGYRDEFADPPQSANDWVVVANEVVARLKESPVAA